MATELTMTRGDTRKYTLTVTQSSVAFDLTGASLWFTAKRQVDDTDAQAVFQKTIGSGITVTSAVGGLAQIVISPTDTDDLPDVETSLAWDVQIKLPSSAEIYTIASGYLLVTPDVTLATT